MKKFRINVTARNGHWTAARISQTALMAMTGVIAILFVLFFTIGFDTPYDENPDFNAPLLTGTVVGLATLMPVAAIAAVTMATIRSIRHHTFEQPVTNGIHSRRIAIAVGMGVLAVMAVTFAIAPTDAVSINGAACTDTLTLRATEMFVDTSLLALTAATATVAIAYYKRMRNKKNS